MRPHVIKFFQFLEAKEGTNAPLRVKLLNSDTFKITKDDLNVDGDLDLFNTNIVTLPMGLKVSGYLDLSDCTSLKELPDGLQVDRDLYLNRCTSLKTLPNGLRVGGELILRGCTSLKSLPDGLRVDKNLYLTNTNIAEMYSADEIRNMIEAKSGYVNWNIYS